MNPSNPEFDLWPSTRTSEPKEEPGVYAIFAKHRAGKDMYLLYIGSTQNLKNRLKRHEVVKKIENCRWDYEVVYYPHLEPHDMEIDFISAQRPLLNINHK